MRSRLRLPRAMSSRVVSAILLVILAVVVFANSWGVFQTDIKPEVYLAPQRMLPRYLSAWTSSPYLGSPNFNVGLVPVLLVTSALRAIGLDAEMAFKVYHLVLWALAAWGANRLLRTLIPSAGVWAGLLAGVAYIANPDAVAAVFGGGDANPAPGLDAQPLTLCPLDVTESIIVRPEDVERWAIPGELGEAVAKALRFYFGFHRGQGIGYLAQVHDLFAAMVACGTVDADSDDMALAAVDGDRGAIAPTADGGRRATVVKRADAGAVHAEFERALAHLR